MDAPSSSRLVAPVVVVVVVVVVAAAVVGGDDDDDDVLFVSNCCFSGPSFCVSDIISSSSFLSSNRSTIGNPCDGLNCCDSLIAGIVVDVVGILFEGVGER